MNSDREPPHGSCLSALPTNRGTGTIINIALIVGSAPEVGGLGGGARHHAAAPVERRAGRALSGSVSDYET